MTDDRKQVKFRTRKALFIRFKATVAKRESTITDVMNALVKLYLKDPEVIND